MLLRRIKFKRFGIRIIIAEASKMLFEAIGDTKNNPNKRIWYIIARTILYINYRSFVRLFFEFIAKL